MTMDLENHLLTIPLDFEFTTLETLSSSQLAIIASNLHATQNDEMVALEARQLFQQRREQGVALPSEPIISNNNAPSRGSTTTIPLLHLPEEEWGPAPHPLHSKPFLSKGDVAKLHHSLHTHTTPPASVHDGRKPRSTTRSHTTTESSLHANSQTEPRNNNLLLKHASSTRETSNKRARSPSDSDRSRRRNRSRSRSPRVDRDRDILRRVVGKRSSERVEIDSEWNWRTPVAHMKFLEDVLKLFEIDDVNVCKLCPPPSSNGGRRYLEYLPLASSVPSLSSMPLPTEPSSSIPSSESALTRSRRKYQLETLQYLYGELVPQSPAIRDRQLDWILSNASSSDFATYLTMLSEARRACLAVLAETEGDGVSVWGTINKRICEVSSDGESVARVEARKVIEKCVKDWKERVIVVENYAQGVIKF